MEELKLDHFLTWLDIQARLKELKATEMAARKFLCHSILQGKEGEFKEALELDGYEIVVNSRVSRKLDEGMLSALSDDLTDEDKNAIRYKPSIDLRAYRKLPDSSLIHEAVTVSPATPSLTVKKVV